MYRFPLYTPYSLLICLLLGQAMAAHAQPLDDLYAAEVAVADDSAVARNTGLRDALSRVLIRLSGSAKTAQSGVAQPVLAAAPALVQQYRYRLQEADDPATPPQRMLWARFEQTEVDRQMRQHDLPVWGAQRPRVLLWLVAEQAGRRSLVNLENDPAGRGVVVTVARDRGMPLQLPLMDLEDQSQLGAADLWNDFRERIATASERYPHDVVLSGRLRAVGAGRWNADWSLHQADGTAQGFTLDGLAWEAALAAGVNAAQDLLAERYAPSGSRDGVGSRIRVAFLEVDSLASYARLLAVLGRQQGISRYALHEVEGDRVMVDIWTNGGRDQLARGLELGNDLQVVSEIALGAPVQAVGQALAPVVDLSYRLNH